MAQRKSPSGGKPAAKKGTSRPAGKPATGSSAKVSTTKPVGATKPPVARSGPPRKPGKSIVNQKQTPWGLIASIAAVVVFAAVVVIVVVATRKSGGNTNAAGGPKCSGANSRYCLPELAAAKQISGVTYKIEPAHNHVTHTVKYDSTPPIGGDHSTYWADASGTVYPNPIASENAVHALEHGSVWVTYRQGLPASEVAKLAADVTGHNYVLMSPYPNLKSKVSLQAWGYQLFVDSVTDPRITQFIATLANNQKIAPEQNGEYQQPTFKAHPSTFGKPLYASASGG
jgi:hypothetical protein